MNRFRRYAAPAVMALGIAAGALGVQPAQALIRTSTPWPEGRVQVCWRYDADDHDYFDDNAPLVRSLVENHWGRAANIQFSGWNVCAKFADELDPPKTVQIHWSEDDENKGPRADVGYYTNKRTFVRLKPVEDYSTSAAFAGDVLHEFGHALGFGHEQDHPWRGSQAATECTAPDPDRDPDPEILSPFDQTSVMGYCSTALNTLSRHDIAGVQNEYGRKPGGALVGHGNKCLDVPNNAAAIGTPLQVFSCNGTANQVWTVGADNTLRVRAGGELRCAEVPNSTISPTSGTRLQTDVCNARDNQIFGLKGMQLRGYGNDCVEVPNANYATGQSLRLNACSTGSNQQWTLVDGRSFKSNASNFCLDVPGSATVGKLLRLAPCTYGASQQFDTTATGELRFGGLCVDARADSSAALQLYTCKPNDVNKRNQQWFLSGAIKGLGGQCLDVRGGYGYDRTAAQLYPCTGGDNQRWDYYFS